MRFEKILVVAGVLALTGPASAQESITEPSQDWVAASSSNSLTPVGVILERQSELGLSRGQVEGLERLGLDVLRAAIQRQAELLIAQLDLFALLDRWPRDAIDVENAEKKIREMERTRSDLLVSFVRAVEVANNQLTPDQRAKLTALIDAEGTSREDTKTSTWSDPPDLMRTAVHTSPGGGRPQPPGGGHPQPPGGAHPQPPGGAHPRPPSGGHAPHRGHSGGFFVGAWPFWWGGYYPYWGWSYPAPPPIVVEPPAYIERPPVYWYYCPSAGAYYPAVETCPEPWMTVVPRTG
jgi:hypothetical protein